MKERFESVRKMTVAWRKGDVTKISAHIYIYIYIYIYIHAHTHTHTRTHNSFEYIYIYSKELCVCIQDVPGGMDKTSGECPLCELNR